MEGEKSDGCPAVPESMPQYDWQCDPRNGTCAEGKCVIVKFTTNHKFCCVVARVPVCGLVA